MDRTTLAHAREEWAHNYADCNPSMTLCADDLIALACGHVRQFHWHATMLTAEDYAILERRAGARERWGEHTPIGRAYLRHLNT
jgi:hypothetical protein